MNNLKLNQKKHNIQTNIKISDIIMKDENGKIINKRDINGRANKKE